MFMHPWLFGWVFFAVVMAPPSRAYRIRMRARVSRRGNVFYVEVRR